MRAYLDHDAATGVTTIYIVRASGVIVATEDGYAVADRAGWAGLPASAVPMAPRPAPAPTPPKPSCRCGKVRYASREAAQEIVVEARLRRALRGSQRRKEDRAYQCRDEPGVWHTTSRAATS